VLKGDLANTYQSYHPGVTTMWLSGFSLKVFAKLQGLTSEQLVDSAPTKPNVMAKGVVVGVLPLALAITSCIMLSYFLIRKITGPRIAFVSACLLALDPFFIAYSQVLHVDALLATFMMVSVLFLLNYMHCDKHSDLILSGLFGGLALLTKSTAFFLLPYTALVAATYKLIIPTLNNKKYSWISKIWKTSRIILLWALIATITFVALWPAMWTQPLEIIERMVQSVVVRVEHSHHNPVFFNNQARYEDPGPLFYIATLGWKTTLVTLPMMLLGIVSLTQLTQSKHPRKIGYLTLFLTAYVAFFTLQMCLSAKKMTRYILPIFPALNVIAGVGINWVADQISSNQQQEKHRLKTAIVGGLVLLQAGLVLPRHPYYGTLHNRLLGGSQVAQHILPLQDQGEGLDLAAKYLNTLPRTQRASASIHTRGSLIFKRYFIGLTNIVYDPEANYRIYFVNQIMRQFDVNEWGKLWEADRQNDPLWTVSFGGVPYVWVYGDSPEKPAANGREYNVTYQLGEHIQLTRYRLSAESLLPGESLTIVPIWTSDGQVKRSYKVFCHILSKNDKLVAQQDGVPLNGVRHTPSWRTEEIIEDSYNIQMESDVQPGLYKISIGMYDLETLERLPIYNADGKRMPNDRIILGSLRVEPPVKSNEE
jgi:hypothetical protein